MFLPPFFAASNERLSDELEFGEHEEGPEEVGGVGGGGFVGEEFEGGVEFGGVGGAGEGGEIEGVEEVGGGGPGVFEEVCGALIEGGGEGLAVGEVEGFEGGDFVGAHGDDLVAVWAAEGAHEEVAFDEGGADHAGAGGGALGEEGGALLLEGLVPGGEDFDGGDGGEVFGEGTKAAVFAGGRAGAELPGGVAVEGGDGVVGEFGVGLEVEACGVRAFAGVLGEDDDLVGAFLEFVVEGDGEELGPVGAFDDFAAVDVEGALVVAGEDGGTGGGGVIEGPGGAEEEGFVGGRGFAIGGGGAPDPLAGEGDVGGFGVEFATEDGGVHFGGGGAGELPDGVDELFGGEAAGAGAFEEVVACVFGDDFGAGLVEV